VLTIAAAWTWLVSSPSMQGSMGGMQMNGMTMAAPALQSWSWNELLPLFVMWAVMMVAMMLPSAAPVILLFSRIGASRAARGSRYASVAFFATGYLVAWWGFSAVAALLQWWLHSAAILSADMRTVSPIAGAGILIAAGVYQWLPVKQACLSHCRSPLGFLSSSWREGRLGAVVMGIVHGAFCVGCCWMLMALLFAAGVMNLAWVAALSLIVLLEKIAPAGPAIARVGGVVLIIIGLAIVV